MGSPDYGPVPMAQFKERSAEVYAALDAGRRVLLSRHGRVIAAIDPASVSAHAPLLASYALQASAVPELSPKTIGQGSPARVIRSLREGSPGVLTRDSKVHGVISAMPVVAMTRADAAREEEQLAAFARENPDAGPEEYAAFSESLAPARAEPGHRVPGTGAPAMTTLLADALHAKGVALEKCRDYRAAEQTLRGAIAALDGSDDRDSRTKAAELLVELSRVYVADDRPADAATAADEALQRIHGLGA